MGSRISEIGDPAEVLKQCTCIKDWRSHAMKKEKKGEGGG